MQTSDLVPRVSDGTATLSPDNLLWKQYEVYVNLFKFYVGVTWKVTTWFATIIGAMLAFQLKSGQPSLRYFLVYPAILSAGLALIFRHGAVEACDLRHHLDYIRDQLRLPGRPHVDILERFLTLGALMFVAVFLGIMILVFFGPGVLR